MGYESKIFIMRRVEMIPKNTYKKHYVYGIEVARYDLGKVYETGFCKLFRMPVDFDIYGDAVGDEEANLTRDCYGDLCRYAELYNVTKWIKERIKTDNYRRWKPLLGMLNVFDRDEPEINKDHPDYYHKNRMIVVHYGY